MFPLSKLLLKVVPGLKLPISMCLDFEELVDPKEENRRTEAEIVEAYRRDPDFDRWYPLSAIMSLLLTPPPVPLAGLRVPTIGESSVNEALVTGESLPVPKAPGSEVIGGTINQTGSFQFRATKVGADTALAQIVQLVAAAQASRPPAQVLADRAAQWLVLAAVVIGVLTFGVWALVLRQPLVFAFTLTVTVFVIAFPIAAGVFYPAFGLLLRPEIAAFTMSGSSALVTFNALLLGRAPVD